jgi:endonuclease/exonuclease/phosphatase family metal-dependent hydrolase
MREKNMLRVMTYNVHSCLGLRGYNSIDDIVEIVREYNPDVFCAQELDVNVSRSGNIDQPGSIARKLYYHYHFVPARPVRQGFLGSAVFSRFPMENVLASPLAGPARRQRFKVRGMVKRPLESRSAIWVRVDHPLGKLSVFNTHLSLIRATREFQVESLLGQQWLGKVLAEEPLIFCGDLNLDSGSKAYKFLASRLSDAQVGGGHKKPRATFPAIAPMRNIDHIFYKGRIQPAHAFVPKIKLTRKASDHLPVVVDFEI